MCIISLFNQPIILDSAEKDKLHRIRTYSETTFDKILVYLAGGGLVLTIGFVKDVIDLKTANSTQFLFFTWICFIVSLTLNLLSHKASTASVDYYLKDDYSAGGSWNKATHWINYLSIGFLLTGILLFIIFVINNISYE